MFFLILLIYFDNEEIFKKLFKFVEHKIKIEKQNKLFKEEKQKLKNYYEDKKRILRNETEKKIKLLDIKVEKEVKQIENKYKKIMDDLDSIKDKKQIIEFLNNYMNKK